MAIRFRRSIKIAPGLKLNIGKKGMSVSTGIRGARLIVGTSRTTTSVGIPGTGFGYTNITSNGSSRRATPKQLEKQLVYESLSNQLSEESDNYERFLDLAKESPEFLQAEDFEEQLKFIDFKPEYYNLSAIPKNQYVYNFLDKCENKFINRYFWITAGLIALAFSAKIESLGAMYAVAALAVFAFNIFKFFKKKNENSRLANESFEQNNKLVEEKKAAHPQNENCRIAALNKIFDGEVEPLESEVEDVLMSFAEYASNLKHKFSVNMTFEYDGAGNLLLDTDLPEVENVIIPENKKVLKSGEISTKEKKVKDINTEYNGAVIGLAFNLAARVFNTSPVIKNIKVIGFTQRVDKANGNVRDFYVYDINFDRTTFGSLNLQSIDVIEALKNFKHTVKLSKEKELEEIAVLKGA